MTQGESQWILQSINSLETQLGRLDEKLDKQDERLREIADKQDERLRGLEKDMTTHLRWLIGLQLAGLTAIAAILKFLA